MVDKDEYSTTQKLKRPLPSEMLADLGMHQGSPIPIGSSTSGSSEAAMAGGMA